MTQGTGALGPAGGAKAGTSGARGAFPAAVLADEGRRPASSRGCGVIAARRARRGVAVGGGSVAERGSRRHAGQEGLPAAEGGRGGGRGGRAGR